MKRAIEKIRQILRFAQEPMSLETPVGDDDDSALVDFIPDDSVDGPVEETNKELLREQVRKSLSSLSEREQKVLALRFGLGGGDSYTLEEVGDKIGVTRERVRQIEAKALRKLRHPTKSRQLRDYLTQ
jgi:RNA polymerase primary sigma factor